MVHSDQWSNFKTDLFQEVCSLLDIYKAQTTATILNLTVWLKE